LSYAAGVFLVIRCSPLFEYAPKALLFIVTIGVVTAIFAATIGLVQNDLKKVIAFSTTSQLGYMVFICGLSSYDVSFFHLINHAFLCDVIKYILCCFNFYFLVK
jgi:NADH-ubiquinone oxidoreductase chain 5